MTVCGVCGKEGATIPVSYAPTIMTHPECVKEIKKEIYDD